MWRERLAGSAKGVRTTSWAGLGSSTETLSFGAGQWGRPQQGPHPSGGVTFDVPPTRSLNAMPEYVHAAEIFQLPMGSRLPCQLLEPT